MEVEIKAYPRSFIAHFTVDTGELTYDNGTIHIIVPEETTIEDEEGNPVTELELAVIETPPATPEGTSIIGSAYDVEPTGAIFDHPVILSWSYRPADIPPGIAEEDLILAYYSGSTGEWVELSSMVDPNNDTITVSIDHLTTFAIIASLPPEPVSFSIGSLSILPSQPDIGESVSISVMVSNTSEVDSNYSVSLNINDTLVETREVSIDSGTSKNVTFTTTVEKAGTYSVDINGITGSFTVRETSINWIILGPVLAGSIALVIVLIIKFQRRRRRYSYYWQA